MRSQIAEIVFRYGFEHVVPVSSTTRKQTTPRANKHFYLHQIWLTLERPRGGGGGQMDPPIGFSDLKFEAFKQSKWNF